MGGVHVHRPRVYRYRAILRCRKCRRRTRHVVAASLYYDPTAKCCACSKAAAAEWRGVRAYDGKACRAALDPTGGAFGAVAC